MVSLGNRVHIFAPPSAKPGLIECFSNVLGCGDPATLNVPGLPEPILAWSFPGGGSLSVEFADDALEDGQARHGAWLELRAADPLAVKASLRSAGFAQIEHLGNDNYFVIPGGHVLRVEAV